MFLFDPLYWECFGERARELFVDKPKAAAEAVKDVYEAGRAVLKFNNNLRKYLPIGLFVSAVGGLGMMQLGGHKHAPEIPVIPEPNYPQPSALRSDWAARVGGSKPLEEFAARVPEHVESYADKISLQSLEDAAKKIRL